MKGERIKLARRRLGLSLRELELKMGGVVTAQAIGKYERGQMSPSSGVLIALSKTLGVSVSYLLAPVQVDLGKIEFRTKSGTTASDRAKVETEVMEWVERYLQIEEILSLGSATWTPPQCAPKMLDCLDGAEQLSDKIREEWSLGIDPITNMTELLEEKGIKVLLATLPNRVSGLTCLVTRGRGTFSTPVVIVNSQKTLERRRFTMAHELAHRLLDDASVPADMMENLCNRFAGAFIAPRAHLEAEIGVKRSTFGFREIIDLKRLYRMSASAFIVRLAQIGAIADHAKEYAFRTFASGWRSSEPEELEKQDLRGQYEKPLRFERLVFRALAEDMISTAKAAELLRLPISSVEEGLKGPSRAKATTSLAIAFAP